MYRSGEDKSTDPSASCEQWHWGMQWKGGLLLSSPLASMGQSTEEEGPSLRKGGWLKQPKPDQSFFNHHLCIFSQDFPSVKRHTDLDT